MCYRKSQAVKLSKTQFGALENRHSLIEETDAQGITLPSVHVEFFRLQGLYAIRIYIYSLGFQ